MTWIEGSPAVIGGVHIGEVMNSVEVFRNNEWKEISPLNISRSSCSAITTLRATWAIGGLSEIRLDSIETYENEWTLLDLKLLQPCSLLGLFNLGNALLLIGARLLQ